MLITAIERRKGTLCALYVEGELAMTLDAETVLEARLKAGQEIGREDLFRLQEKSDLRRARERALSLLSYKAYSKQELTDKLARESGPQAAAQVADRMEELGLLDDEDYAMRYARERAVLKGYGGARIRQELQRKGIDRELIDRAVAQAEAEADPQAQVAALISRKYGRYLGDRRGEDKIVAAMLRRGYRYEDVRRALDGLRHGTDPADGPDFEYENIGD